MTPVAAASLAEPALAADAAPGAFESWARHRHSLVEASIAGYVAELPAHSPLVAPIAHALTGGKRFRALLAHASCEAFGGNADAVGDTALALELVQAQSLILDDLPCMDDAELRRGALSTHVRFGESLAVLSAATLLSDAYALLARKADASTARRVMVLAEACGARGIANGQAIELAGNPALDYAAKTAPLMAAAAELGACCAGETDARRLGVLRAFAHAVGIAYQLRDDAIDEQAQHPQLAARTADALCRGLADLACAGVDTRMLRALARHAALRPH
jgi:geranylgeranyl pyrophosphate synthase